MKIYTEVELLAMSPERADLRYGACTTSISQS